MPALPLSAYTGKYHSLIYGDAEVTLDGDHLVLTIGPAKEQILLYHFDRDIFLFSGQASMSTVSTKRLFL